MGNCNKVSGEIKKLHGLPVEDVADNLDRILEKLIEESMKSYARKAGSLVMKNSDWRGKITHHSSDLKN